MARVQVRDHVLWIAHITGDQVLQAELSALRAGESVMLEVAGRAGQWIKMSDNPSGKPTPGLKPQVETRAFWHEMQSRRGEWVEIELRAGNAPSAQLPSPSKVTDAITPANSRPTPLARSTTRNGSTMPSLVAHADWGVDRKKRFVTVATLCGEGQYSVGAPRPVGPLDGFFRALNEEAGNGCVLLGLDCPIGVPKGWAHMCGLVNFRQLLSDAGREPWHQFFDVARVAEEISLTRPFFPAGNVEKGTVTREQHWIRMGLKSEDLLRRCDCKTANRPRAESLFWTLGGKQVGKGAIVAWRDLIVPALGSAPTIALWPFDGTFEELVARGGVVVAETYPGEVYHHLGISFGRAKDEGKSGKRVRIDRIAQSTALLAWAAETGQTLDEELTAAIMNGFGDRADGEDRFDSVVGAMGMLNVVLGRRASGEPRDDTDLLLEGWILGQQA